jgi:hypothetical protein
MGIITVFIKSSNRRPNHMAKNKETSTRGTSKGQKLLSGTRDQLMKDLQRVHKLFPTAVPNRDFYRKHGKYADAACKEHFPRFKDFVAAAGLTPVKAVCWYLDQAAEVLKQHAEDLSEQELEIIIDKSHRVLPIDLSEESQRRVSEALARYEEKSDREIDEILAMMKEEERLEAEEDEKRLQQAK